MVFALRSQIKPSAVSVATSATKIPTTALTGRTSIAVKNNGSNTIYLGDSTVTTTNGYPLAAGAEISLDLSADVDLYGRVASGTENARILEGV